MEQDGIGRTQVAASRHNIMFLLCSRVITFLNW